MANNLFNVGGPLGPVTPGGSGFANPLAQLGFGIYQGNPLGAMQGMALQQQAGAQLAMLQEQMRIEAEQRRQVAQAREAAGGFATAVGMPMATAMFPGLLQENRQAIERGLQEAPVQSFNMLQAMQPKEPKADPLTNVLVDGRPTMLPRSQAAGLPTAWTPKAPEAPGAAEFSPGDRWKYEQGLRREFTAESSAFQEIANAYGRIIATNPTPAGDLSMIFNYMKLLDPGSTVREGEFKTAATAAPLLERIGLSWDTYSKVWEGRTLTEAQRRDFMRQARNIVGGALGQQERLEGQFSAIADRAGLNPENVITRYLTKKQRGALLAPDVEEVVSAGADRPAGFTDEHEARLEALTREREAALGPGGQFRPPATYTPRNRYGVP